VALLVALADPAELSYGMPPLVATLLRISPAIAVLTVGVLLCALLAWKNGYWRFSARLHYTGVLAACVAMVWFLNYWNLLRFTA